MDEGKDDIRARILIIFAWQILAWEWNAQDEEFQDKSSDITLIGRIRDDIFSLDRYLGAYPLDLAKEYQAWQRLTSYVDRGLVYTIYPNNGRLSQHGVPLSELAKDEKIGIEDTTMQPPVVPDTTTEANYTRIDLRQSFPKKCTPAERTQHSLDKTWLLEQVLSNIGGLKAGAKTFYGGKCSYFQVGTRRLLGEMQIAFVSLLLGYDYYGLLQWKTISVLICSSAAAISKAELQNDVFIPFCGKI